MRVSEFHPTALDPQLVTRRRTRVATLVLSLTVPAVLVMADLHWRSGFDVWKVAHLFLFTLLFALLAFGAAQAWMGFRLRVGGGDPLRIIRTLGPRIESMDAPTAVIMPICNEDVNRVMNGMRAIYESVRADGRLPNCDFFLLSDSTNPNNWVEEEAAWLALVKKVDAHGRLFYRKRRVGINKKAGNVADFCRRWGSHYRYMVVLDADSVISGEAVAKLVCLMERNPKVGLIQGVPVLVNGETIFARVQQFASRLYGTIFSAGLNYWQLGEANYWGHNAIIRVEPFMRHCSLPELPGDGPFGGRILSHDYVEAALMRRAGWQVWLATDLPGNYEECPANLIDFAKRDRRWLQGNLQHARLIVARGFHAVNRLHFLLGIFSYLASPLWFALLMLSCVIAWRAGAAAGGATAGLPPGFGAQALLLFGATLTLLLLPKLLALLDLRRRPEELHAFGGWSKVAQGVLGETFVFTLIAPILMLFHTKFVILTLCRQTIAWGSQRRNAAGGPGWIETLSAHLGHTLFGIALAVLVVRVNSALAWWMSPLLAGMILSIPISFITGSPAIGARVRMRGIFSTPEEREPGAELRQLSEVLAAHVPGRVPPPELVDNYGLLQAVIDPYVNAAHVSLLRAKDQARPSATELRLTGLREMLLRQGPTALNARDRVALLSDVDTMVALHEEIWAEPPERLAPWWRLALQHYHVVADAPRTAFAQAA